MNTAEIKAQHERELAGHQHKLAEIEQQLAATKQQLDEAKTKMREREKHQLALETTLRAVKAKIVGINNYDYPNENDAEVLNRELGDMEKALHDIEAATEEQRHLLDEQKAKLTIPYERTS